MENLPLELVGVVVENIPSASDLLSLRSVNSACHHLATPHAFRKLHIRNSVHSAQGCRSVLASPTLATYVREIVYDKRDHERFCLLPASAQGTCDELEIAELEDVLTETFCSLTGFKNLESVVLNFWPSFRSQHGVEIREHPFWFTNRQVVILHAIHHALRSSSIHSLVLNNIVLMSPSCYDFVSSVQNSPIHHFSMSVISNSERDAWSGSKSFNGPLSSLLPTSNANLKSLVLRSPGGLYHSLNTQLRFSHYSTLETLVLENIVFDPSPSANGIEEFIVRHKASLRRLELRSCSSYVHSTTTPLRKWGTIWKRLEEELDCLTEIVVDDTHQGYTLLDETLGYIPHPSPAATPAELAQEDEEHYLHFRELVNLRSILAKERRL